MALGEDELFKRLTVDFLSRLLKFLVVEEIEAACCDDGGDCDENDMRVVCSLALARNRLGAEMDQKDHVIELKDGLIKEDSESPKAL